MIPRDRRGMLILGMASAVALLAFLAYAAHTAALSNYRAAGRLRWRLAAQQMAQGGIATACARLAERAEWKEESWEIPCVGGVEVRVIARGLKDDPAGVLVEASAGAPTASHPQERAILRAVLRPSGGERVLRTASVWWISPGAQAAPSEANP